MILVKRKDKPAQLNPTNPDSVGEKEFLEAMEYLEEHGEPPPPTFFKAYKNDNVKQALTNLFHGKCAYCESKVSGSSQTDIEHYRPKGGVEGQPGHPGYWWLAMRWENLVLSCMHCNQHRRQLLLDKDMSEEEIEQAIVKNDLQTSGKKNAFPTEDGYFATDHTVRVADEKPLLIDPTITNPEPLIDWAEREDFALAVAVNDNLRAQTTIDVLGLNRQWLCEQRMTLLSELILMMDNLHDWANEIDNASTDGEARLALKAAQEVVERVEYKCEARMPHAAIARRFLGKAQKVLHAAIS